jgi:hypothetical protein
MSTSDLEKQPPSLNRRQLMAGLAALGIVGSSATQAAAQAKANIPALEGASELLGEHFSPKDLQIIATALERNLEQFENVRLFMVPDSIEPAPMFMPLRYDEHPPLELNIGMIQQDTKEITNA